MNRLTAPLTTITATALRTLVGATLLLCAANAQAFGILGLLNQPDPSWGFINNRQFVSGYVYTRGIYKNDQGYPVYVEYNAQGEEVAEIGPLDPNGPYGNTRIMAAREYQAYVEQYEADLQQFRDTYPNTDEPELLTLSAYQTRIGTLTTATEPAEPWTGTDADTNLNPGTRSVLVRPQSLLYTPTSPYLMRQYPIDMTQYQSMAGQTGSLLIDRNGQIVRTSQYRIALRAVYYENPNGSSPKERFESSSFVSSLIRTQGIVPTLTNPVQALPLSSGLASRGWGGTNEAGQYSMMITATPCPTFFYQYDEVITGMVPYRAFNPDISSGYQYPIIRSFPFTCNGMATYNFHPSPNPPLSLDFPIDVNILTGAIRVPGVELAAPGTAPVYDLEAPDAFTQTQADYYDFDLDGTPDTTYCGVQDENGLFVQEADCQIATVQGVYLSSAPNDPNGEGCSDDPAADLCQPNLLRVIDLEPIQEDKALVSQLAPEHLKDTDLFIIRQATGQLIAQRQGLKDDEAAYEPAFGDGMVDNDLNLAQSELRIDYGMIMRGMAQFANEYSAFRAWGEEGGFSDWQAKGNMAPELYAYRTSDQVRAGETLEVWAINRVTGYLGHAEIVVGEDQISDGLLDTRVPDIELAAPNLKIWAERRYNIEAGLTKDEQRDYLISHEGAGEGDDTFIQIFVEWLDQDGSALPDALKDYGYTGRLAYVSGENTLSDASQAGQARFNIQPGKHSELLRLPSTSDNNLHYYVQVNGIPYNDYTDFALGDQNRSSDVSFEGTAENNYRPERFVPVKVPQYDEEVSTLQQQAYLTEKRRREEAGISLDGLTKPIPLHGWYHRPEYQFSVYDLTVDSINLVGQDPDNTDEEVLFDIKDSPDPKITGADIINILYSLQGSDEDRLSSLDGEQTLILALGQQETEITLTENNTLRFENLDYLNQLGSDDYLTIAVYTNADAGNLLWEFAFGKGTGLFPDTEIISVDRNELELTAVIPVDLDVPEAQREDISLRWTVRGSGRLEQDVTTSNDGMFSNNLIVETDSVGEHIYLSVEIIHSTNPSYPEGVEQIYGPYEVIAGQPANLQLDADSQHLLASGVDTSTVTATVTDQFGNAVIDGTPIGWSADYGYQIRDEDTFTIDGMATVKVLADVELLSGSVTAEVNRVRQSKPFTKRELTTQISVNKSNLSPGETATVTFQLSEAPQEPIPILWHATRGTLVGPEMISGTEVQATLIGGSQPGDGLITAGIEGHPQSLAFTVAGQTANAVELDLPAIASGGNEVEVETLSGFSNYTPPNQTAMYLNGTPGSTMTLALGGLYTPNGMPLALLGMDDIVERVQQDGSVQATVYNAAAQTYAQLDGNYNLDLDEAYTLPGASFYFEGDTQDRLRLAATPAINRTDDLALNLRIRPDVDISNDYTDGSDPEGGDTNDEAVQVIPVLSKGDEANFAYQVALERYSGESLYRVHLRVNSTAGEYSILSEPLVQPKEWSLIGFQLQNNVLTLGIGGARYHQAIDGNLIDQSVNSPLIVGGGFRGNIDDIRLFSLDSAEAILAFADGSGSQEITFDANGRAQATLRATGLTSGIHQRVGISSLVNIQGSASASVNQELNIATRALNRLLPVSMRSAWAEEIEGAQQINELEQGVAVVGDDEFAQAMEFIKQSGQQAYDLFKSAAELLFDLSGFSDVWTIGKAIYLWMDDRFDEVDKFDLVFAGIGLTLTIVAVATAPVGGASTLALKGSLRGLKSLLKESVSDPVMLLRAGGTAINWTFSLLKNLFGGRDGREAAMASLVDLNNLLTDMFSTGGQALLTFFTKVVRAPAQFSALIKLHKISKAADVCTVASAPRQAPSRLAWARVTGLSLLLAVQPAYGADYLCGEGLVNTAKQYFENRGEDFVTLVHSLDALSSGGKLAVSADTIRKMAELADAGHIKTLDNLLTAMKKDNVVYYYPAEGKAKVSIARFADTAERNGEVLDVSNFDYFIDSLHYATTLDSSTNITNLLSKLNPTKTGLISSFRIRQVFGELDAIKRIRSMEEYSGTTIKTVDDRVLDNSFGARRNNVEGVDSVHTWPDRGDLSIESKNWSESRYNGNRANIDAYLTDILDRQFVKHLQEQVIRNIEDVSPSGVVNWVGGGKPRIHYVLNGGFWGKSGTTKEEVLERFKKIVREQKVNGNSFEGSERLSDWLDKTPEEFDALFDDLIKVDVVEEIVPPFTS